jgi:hypothetical protein
MPMYLTDIEKALESQGYFWACVNAAGFDWIATTQDLEALRKVAQGYAPADPEKYSQEVTAIIHNEHARFGCEHCPI